MRGRNRGSKGPNPLTRAYESNGPDVKVRGTAQHIAEKYSQLARDAQSSGDPVAAENYLQHAEHYYRIILTAQEQLRQQYGTTFQRPFDDEDDGDDEGYNGSFGGPDRPLQHQAYPASPDDMDLGSQPQPFPGGFDPRNGEDRGDRFDRGPRQDRGEQRFDNGPRQDRGDGQRQDRGERRFDRGPRPERGEQRFDNGPRQDRGDGPRQDRGEQRRERFRDRDRDQPRGDAQPRDVQPREPRAERVEIAGEGEAQPQPPRREERPRRERRPEVSEEAGGGLPAFLTNPVRTAPVETAPDEAPAAAPPAADGEAGDLAPRPRRRRRPRAGDAPEAGAESRDPTPVE